MKAIGKAQEYSNSHINLLREKLGNFKSKEDYSIVLGGSYARREASEESDLDFYIIASSNAAEIASKSLPDITDVLTKTIKAPGSGGPFGIVHSTEKMQ
jgi:predicted nucleotidyltransferase